jgi:leucyl-tRNA---protein transferase
MGGFRRRSTQFPPRISVVDSPEFGLISLDFLAQGETHPCPYLPDKEAREEFFSSLDFEPELYHDFMDCGFRRSGLAFYRPICGACRECRPLRVSSSGFGLTRSYRRVLKKNRDIGLSVAKPRLTIEKIAMYRDYLDFQHSSSHANSPDDLERFLYHSPVNTVEFEYTINGRAVCASIADICSRSLSSVYVYFDPDHAWRSLGTLAAVSEILLCREKGIPFYYLGFYIADCPAMNYKARFKPHQLLSPDGTWEELTAT